MKSRRVIAILLLVLLLVAVPLAVAQQVSQKKDIAVFKLSYYQWDIPDSVLGGIDEEIRGVFVNIGRFNVLGMTQRLEPGDLTEFIDKIKSYKEERAEIPDAVQMGREFFTQADFDRLVGSFLVVVPSVASYVLEVEDDGEFHVALKTSFSFVNVEEGRTFAQAFVETEGTEKSPDGAARSALDGIAMLLTYEIRKIPEFQLKTGVLEVKDSGEFHVALKTSFSFVNVEQGTTFAQAFVETDGTEKSPDAAAKSAIDAIPFQLTYEVRKIPEFQLKTGVLEVQGSEVILELGRDMGIKVGDEFVLVASRVLQSGKTLTTENGLLVIKEVSDEVSVGKVLYAKPKPQEGDQLREFPLSGVETTPYLHVASGLLFDRPMTALIGLKQSVSRGFYGVRPVFGLEVPLIANLLAGIPLNLYGGVEYMMYLGRLSVAPMAAAGIGGAYLWYADVPKDEKFALTYVGGQVGLTVSYLFSKKFRLALDAGYLLWFSLVPTKYFFEAEYLFPDYDGLFVGAGLTIKL